MTQQHDAEDIQRQFAELQAEMRRAMAEAPAEAASSVVDPPETDTAGDFQRIERGLDALRRDADRLRARIAPPPTDGGGGQALADLRARTEEIGRRAEDSTTKLARAVQGNREAIEDLTVRLEALSQRRPGVWLLPLSIVFGAMIVAAAMMLDDPGRIERLIDRITAIVSSPKPHADNAPPAPVVAQAAPEPAPIEPAPPETATVASSPVAPADAEAPTPPAVAPPMVPMAVDAPARGRITLRAKEDSWVEVRNRQGAALLARLMRDGDVWPVPDQAALLLSTGNAGGLELLVDGTPAPALGNSGAVRRDVPLDADLVRAGRYTADPALRPKVSAASR